MLSGSLNSKRIGSLKRTSPCRTSVLNLGMTPRVSSEACWRRWGRTTETAQVKELSAITSAGHAFDFEVSLVEATAFLSYFVQGSSGEGKKEGDE
jgi:hypothetical protein